MEAFQCPGAADRDSFIKDGIIFSSDAIGREHGSKEAARPVVIGGFDEE